MCWLEIAVHALQDCLNIIHLSAVFPELLFNLFILVTASQNVCLRKKEALDRDKACQLQPRDLFLFEIINVPLINLTDIGDRLTAVRLIIS